MTDTAFNSEINAPARDRLDTETLRALMRRSLFPWLNHAVSDWCVIAAALAAVGLWPHFYTVLAAILIVGNRQHALAILGHDGTHYTLSRSAMLNDFLTNLFCFWPLGLTVSGYRALHYKHHKNTGTEDDPELGHKRMRSPQWDLPTTPLAVLRYALMDLVGHSFADYLIIVRFSTPQRRRDSVQLGLFHIAAVSLVVWLGWWPIAAAWYFSLVTSFMMFFRLRLWLEHQGTDDTQRLKLAPWQGAILSPHDAWHHWEHHKYPAIPYHSLARVRRLLDGPPTLTLRDLIAVFESARRIPSGTPLSRAAESGSEEIRMQ